MLVTQEELTNINRIQVEILKEVDRVCNLLNIKYFMVHGSLLGAVLTGKFMPFDDDIDIAMHRSDYERFISEAPTIILSKYFVQSNKTDKDYPIGFTKVRDSGTTYIIESLRHLNINHGIYIDVFPIDYCVEGKIASKWFDFKEKMLTMRIGCKIHRKQVSLSLKIKQLLSCIIYPSWKRAVILKENLIQSVKNGDCIRLTGGKGKENGIPAEWFGDTEVFEFEGVSINAPKRYDSYLTAIYGDYKNCFLADGKMHGDNKVEINAYIVDTKNPYIKYI